MFTFIYLTEWANVVFLHQTASGFPLNEAKTEHLTVVTAGVSVLSYFVYFLITLSQLLLVVAFSRDAESEKDVLTW